VVVTVGLTVIGVPLVMAVFPGVTTPVPFTKTAVRVALDPTSTAAGLAAKLVMEGTGGGGGVELDEPPQPVKPAKPRLRAKAPAKGTKRCLKGFPV
jgi:hypothetical protein